MNVKKDVLVLADRGAATVATTVPAAAGSVYRFGRSTRVFYVADEGVKASRARVPALARLRLWFSGRTFPIIAVLGLAVLLCYLAVVLLVVNESASFSGGFGALDAKSMAGPARAVSLQH